MLQILGQITKRLLKQHGKDSKAWFLGRPADVPQPKRGKKLPEGVDGTSMTGRHRK